MDFAFSFRRLLKKGPGSVLYGYLVVMEGLKLAGLWVWLERIKGDS